jgi:hypothetical protein
MSLKTTNYGAARSVLGLAEIILWCGIGGGIILAIIAGGAASNGFGGVGAGLAAAMPGIAISVFSFIGVVMIQVAKASVDTADYTFQMLGIARDQLAVSKEANKQLKAPQSFAEDRKSPPKHETRDQHAVQGQGANDARSSGTVSTPKLAHSSATDAKDWDYRSKRIHYTSHGAFLVEGRTFETLEKAKLHVDGLALRAELAQS